MYPRPAAYLRNPFWRNKGAGLDGLEPCFCQPLNQLDLGWQRNGCLLVLQPITWAHLDDLHAVVKCLLLLLLLLLAGGIRGGRQGP